MAPDAGGSETRAPIMATAIILCPTVAVVVVGLRLYTRFFLCKTRFLEDVWITLAALSSIAMSIFMGLSVVHGFGRHIATVSEEQIRIQLKVGIGGIQFYMLTHLFLKVSIMLQYIRISVMRLEIYLCYALLALLVMGSIALQILHFCTCTPFAAFWDRDIAGARCLDRKVTFSAQLGFVLAFDLIILLTPTVLLRHLTLSWWHKFGIGLVLAFGGLACILSIFRLHTLTKSTRSPDITWDKVPSALFGVIEPNVGIVCASVITFRPLARRFLPKRLARRCAPRENAIRRYSNEAPNMVTDLRSAGAVAGIFTLPSQNGSRNEVLTSRDIGSASTWPSSKGSISAVEGGVQSNR